MNKGPFIINKDNKNNNEEKIEGNIKIKTINNNLYNILYNVKKYVQTEGYLKFGGNNKNYEYEGTNGYSDIFLCLKKYKKGYVNLNYSFQGTFQFFKKFKDMLDNIKRIIEN